MDGFLAISHVQSAQLHAVLRKTIQDGLDTGPLQDFLALLDWSEDEAEDTAMGVTLLNLANWATMFEEGELNTSEFANKLVGLMPTGGEIAFTLVYLDQEPTAHAAPAQWQPLPQTGSEIGDAPALRLPEKSNVLQMSATR